MDSWLSLNNRSFIRPAGLSLFLSMCLLVCLFVCLCPCMSGSVCFRFRFLLFCTIYKKYNFNSIYRNCIKVTVYLQGCLARKQCSPCSLSCRYLNPYIKLKLMELAIKLYQNELSNFSRPLNASARITFRKLQVKANFVFRQFNFFLRFRAQSA